MKLQVTAADAFQGKAMRKWEAHRRAFQQAVHGGIKETTNSAKDEWRSAVRAAGLGPKLANTIRGQTYPERGFSASAAGSVWTRAPVIIDAYTRGERVRTPDGGLMAIPTANVTQRLPKTGKVAAVEARFGKLDYVKLDNSGDAVAMLVARKVQRSKGKRGGFRRASARSLRQGTAERAVMFWLVRSFHPRKRLPDVRTIGRRQMRRISTRILRNLQKLERQIKP